MECFFMAVVEAYKNGALDAQCEASDNYWKVNNTFPDDDFSMEMETNCYLTPACRKQEGTANYAVTYIRDNGERTTNLYSDRDAAVKDFRDSFFNEVEEAGKRGALEILSEINEDGWKVDCSVLCDGIMRSEVTNCFLTPVYYNDDAADRKEG